VLVVGFRILSSRLSFLSGVHVVGIRVCCCLGLRVGFGVGGGPCIVEVIVGFGFLMMGWMVAGSASTR
jgi:hypothetical protein